MSEFGKWWNDPKKHCKRLHHWLPHWKGFAAQIQEARIPRYFTLCARSMIDVFMLVKEGILTLDPGSHSIRSVRFCECDQQQFAEIKDLVAKEDAGFFGRLEDVVLFSDTVVTEKFPTLDSITLALEDEGLAEDIYNQLAAKRTHLNFQSSFPYDFVNLDFCDYYYPQPPDMLRINRTVEHFLDWQRATSEDDEKVDIAEFIMAVTCRHDAQFPLEAGARLVTLIQENCDSSAEYKESVAKSRGNIQIDEWLAANKEDFFFSGWPKDIAQSARDRGWAISILDYVYYQRTGDHDENPYVIACLVAKFTRTSPPPNYIQAALYALDPKNRKLIGEMDKGSQEGQLVHQSLIDIVALRNEQARRMQRPELPDP